ncbi:MAG: NRDE family protein [Pseudomonadales bacterium]|nr:NRDE family protein [Pseudomonadales bacterium]
MCLIFIAIDSHPDYPVIIAANRDEFYQRPTESAHFWPASELLAGKDTQAGGTWLGINRQGQFAAVTNFRETETQTYNSSRGELPCLFLNQRSQANFEQHLQKQSPHYAGFNCLFGQLGVKPQLSYFSNRQNKLIPLSKGLYGLSNALLDSNWFKIEQGKENINTLLNQDFNHEEWFNFLKDQVKASDNNLPDTGIAIETERLLSSRFIHSPDYGTRCSTLITVDKKARVQFCERSYDEHAQAVATHFFDFPIN